ncbi:hypothetical protein [Streptomyces sp. 3214.6]|uniref:hypothetical protein n=1 Tax=Streptomyces sp. 3214.6 TaxID=1882757 RepID=UPI00090A259B|nr:hypothetical protein [Streptomyces sp. 3214.6]SHI66316.1 hypothetical protein SAMN05444521_8172 [Streptomyces sp. 3214.6]
MGKRLVIDCHELWDKVIGQPDGLHAVQGWLRLNGIDPRDVPLDSEMVIEDSAFGMVIRYTAYLYDEQGRKYVDPDAPEFAASQDRTAVLKVAPAPEWLSTTGGDR